MMTSLNEMKEDLPEELASTVDELTTTLEAVEDPGTSPQDRQGVIESARQLTTALTTIADDSTPDELREQLITLVKETSFTLRISQDPQVPPEEQSLVIVVVKRSTSAVKMICDPETPQEQRDQQIPTMRNLYAAVGRAHGEPRVADNAVYVSTGLATAAAPETPPEQSEELTETAHRHSQSLRKYSDPKTSAKEKAEAKTDMEDQGARMGEEQEDAASTDSEQEASLAEEARVCTNAVFESVAEHRLAEGLKDLVPDSWDTEGVKDFWKAKVSAKERDEFLDVLAQLRNDANVHAPVEIAQLITELAELVPRDRLFAALGSTPASQCEQTASDLDQDYDVEVGNWLVEAGEE
ncbi:hypothetical protein AB0H86_14220 [Streptomyces sp. NPDC050997]|uniref:hypothetical protein n=1 Tax=Streptomyces sp. NPDC050997 TaxID=3155519 RepID=UPI003437AD45